MENDLWLSPASLGKLIWYTIQLWALTLKIRKVGFDEKKLGNSPRIYALWHGRMFIPLYCMRWRNIHVLVSEHRDGEIISSTLRMYGHSLIRGSSTRGGIRALAGMLRLARNGVTTAFTPDGPRGPKEKVQPGIIYLAQRSGLPIIPLSGGASRKHHFGSWDNFLLPLPFSSCVFTVGEPLYIRENSEGSITQGYEKLERELNRITQLADEIACSK